MSEPHKIIQAGKAKASIFRNVVKKYGKEIDVPKIKLDIIFKDKRTGKWKSTSSIALSELPSAITVLVLSYLHLVTKP